MSEWKPIDVASLKMVGPMTEQIICGHLEKKWVRFGRFYPQVGKWYYSGTSERSQYAQTEGDAPTHWMPLPKPPSMGAP